MRRASVLVGLAVSLGSTFAQKTKPPSIGAALTQLSACVHQTCKGPKCGGLETDIREFRQFLKDNPLADKTLQESDLRAVASLCNTKKAISESPQVISFFFQDLQRSIADRAGLRSPDRRPLEGAPDLRSTNPPTASPGTDSPQTSDKLPATEAPKQGDSAGVTKVDGSKADERPATLSLRTALLLASIPIVLSILLLAAGFVWASGISDKFQNIQESLRQMSGKVSNLQQAVDSWRHNYGDNKERANAQETQRPAREAEWDAGLRRGPGRSSHAGEQPQAIRIPTRPIAQSPAPVVQFVQEYNDALRNPDRREAFNEKYVATILGVTNATERHKSGDEQGAAFGEESSGDFRAIPAQRVEGAEGDHRYYVVPQFSSVCEPERIKRGAWDVVFALPASGFSGKNRSLVTPAEFTHRDRVWYVTQRGDLA